jgi:hypothetical protein
MQNDEVQAAYEIETFYVLEIVKIIFIHYEILFTWQYFVYLFDLVDKKLFCNCTL